MKKFFTSIWFLALIVAVPVICFLPDMFSKYKTNLLVQFPNTIWGNHVYFEDLDGDGVKEKISCHKNSANKLAFQLHTKEGAIKSQQNFNYNYNTRLSSLYFGDVDNNRKLEIYGFSLKDDSLYLNWFEPGTVDDVQKSKFITQLGTFDIDKIDISIIHFEVVDLENDGKNEILISIEAGYSINPRILVVYKPNGEKLIRSADKGLCSYTPFLYDLDNDGTFEIITSSYASDNLFSATGISGVDDRPWLQVFNSELKHFFEPVPFPEGLSNTTQTFVTKDGKNDLLVFNCNRSREKEKIIQLHKFNNKGNRTDSRYLSEFGKEFQFKIFQAGNEFLIYAGNEVFWVNNDLRVIKHKEIAPSLSIVAIDTLSKLNQPFFIARTHLQNELTIYTEDFDEAVHLIFEGESIKSVLTKTDSELDRFFVRTDKQEYFFSFKRNNLYFLKYPLFVIIYILSVAFMWLINKIVESRLKEKYELQSQVRDLQLKTLKNQLDPHFIFNTFNTIASVVKQGRNDEAYDIMVRFSKMVRSNLENPNDIYTTLKREIDFVKDFLSIQNFRFKNKFEYNIHLEKGVDTNVKIPKLLIQIHVENALKHGIRPADYMGLIQMKVYRQNDALVIHIEDNGIGRKKAKKLKTGGTGIGLSAIQQIVDVNNQNKKNKITQEIIDIFDSEGNSKGTRVEIILHKL